MITLSRCVKCEVERRIKARGLCFTCYNFYYRKGLIRKRGRLSRPYLTWTEDERRIVADCLAKGLVYADVADLLPGRTRKQFNSVLWNVRNNVVAWTRRPKVLAVDDKEPSVEEIERTVSEQRRRLPEWWEKSSPKGGLDHAREFPPIEEYA